MSDFGVCAFMLMEHVPQNDDDYLGNYTTAGG